MEKDQRDLSSSYASHQYPYAHYYSLLLVYSKSMLVYDICLSYPTLVSTNQQTQHVRLYRSLEHIDIFISSRAYRYLRLVSTVFFFDEVFLCCKASTLFSVRHQSFPAIYGCWSITISPCVNLLPILLIYKYPLALEN